MFGVLFCFCGGKIFPEIAKGFLPWVDKLTGSGKCSNGFKSISANDNPARPCTAG
jgi:hypothetical protein